MRGIYLENPAMISGEKALFCLFSSKGFFARLCQLSFRSFLEYSVGIPSRPTGQMRLLAARPVDSPFVSGFPRPGSYRQSTLRWCNFSQALVSRLLTWTSLICELASARCCKPPQKKKEKQESPAEFFRISAEFLEHLRQCPRISVKLR